MRKNPSRERGIFCWGVVWGLVSLLKLAKNESFGSESGVLFPKLANLLTFGSDYV